MVDAQRRSAERPFVSAWSCASHCRDTHRHDNRCWKKSKRTLSSPNRTNRNIAACTAHPLHIVMHTSSFNTIEQRDSFVQCHHDVAINTIDGMAALVWGLIVNETTLDNYWRLSDGFVQQHQHDAATIRRQCGWCRCGARRRRECRRRRCRRQEPSRRRVCDPRARPAMAATRSSEDPEVSGGVSVHKPEQQSL